MTQDELNKLDIQDEDNAIFLLPKHLVIQWLRANTNAFVTVEEIMNPDNTTVLQLVMKTNSKPYPGFVYPFNIAVAFHNQNYLSHLDTMHALSYRFGPINKTHSNHLRSEINSSWGTNKYLHINNQPDPEPTFLSDNLNWTLI